MFNSIAKGLAALSLMLKQPLSSFCDLDTVDGDALVGRRGERITFLRVKGLRRMTMRHDVEAIANGLRMELSGSLEAPGHAIQAWYACDPSQSGGEIERQLQGNRRIARELGLHLTDIFTERGRLWPRIMRWEACYFVLWSKPGLLNREEAKQAKEEMQAFSKGAPSIGDAMSPFKDNEVLSAKHGAFLQRVTTAFRNHGIAVEALSPAEALVAAREAIYPESANSDWVPMIPGRKPMPRMPDGEPQKGDAGLALWPPLVEQMFFADAVTHGQSRVTIGGHEWASSDMTIGPEDPRPFAEIAARMNATHVPWRMSMLVEGGGRNMMAFKKVAATLLGFVPSNRQIFKAFESLDAMRSVNIDIAVKLRTSFATWVPEGETGKLRRQIATLRQRIEGWGNCAASSVAGDPLDGVMSSALGMAMASTAPAGAAPLGEALRMMPWGRPASPWSTGAMLFRTPDGRMWPYDPAGSKRTMIMDLFVAPPGFGKSVLANSVLLALCLSYAALGASGAKLPLIGKLDVGPSAEGFVKMLLEALPDDRRHEVIHVVMQLRDGYEVNIFDTQVGCRRPLDIERAFQQNFLSLSTSPLEGEAPFEGMDQLIGFVIEEAYRMLGDSGPNIRPKVYHPGVLPNIDEVLREARVELEHDAWWWEVVDALCRLGKHRLAEQAQRYAVPVLQDLMEAVRSTQVKEMFAKVRAETTEETCDLFERYIKSLIRKYPTLNRPTRLDFGPARVIVLDLGPVAPAGSSEADRQTDLMYLLGRHILARNFFLHPDYIKDVPELVREYHTKRFQEVYETTKRLDYDEYHRTKGRRFVREQVERDRREGRKHNLQLGVSSQRISDFGGDLVGQSTGRFILGAGDEQEAEEMIRRFHLTEASAEVVRHRLKGPDENGSGSPFLLIMDAENVRYEQMLVNSLGPVELWALSTSPSDVALRARLYKQVGFSEGLRRVSRVFASGTAAKEISRRKEDRLRRGEEDGRAQSGVIDELAMELIDGRGLGIVLRKHEADERAREVVQSTPMAV